jgi:hypothetical protein
VDRHVDRGSGHTAGPASVAFSSMSGPLPEEQLSGFHRAVVTLTSFPQCNGSTVKPESIWRPGARCQDS